MQTRKTKLNKDYPLSNKFIAALEFCAPPINSLLIQDLRALASFQAFKTIVMRYHNPLSVDILFHPLHSESGEHLFALSTFDPDLFLHMVRYADNEAIDRTLIASDRWIPYTGLSYLIERYQHCHGLVLRPLFEKVSQKAVDLALVDDRNLHPSVHNLPYHLMKHADPYDALALLKRIKPETFKEVAKKVNLVKVLISAGNPRFVEVILPHLQQDVVFKFLTDENEKPLDDALTNYKGNESIVKTIFRRVTPSAPKDYCCNEAAVRLIELLPCIPPIDSLFDGDHLANFFEGHPLAYAVVNNPKLLNMLLRRMTEVDIIKQKNVLFEVFSYLEADVAKRVCTYCPDLIPQKELLESKITFSSLTGKLTKISYPFKSYSGSKENNAHVQSKIIAELIHALPKDFNGHIRRIILVYAIKYDLEEKADEVLTMRNRLVSWVPSFNGFSLFGTPPNAPIALDASHTIRTYENN